MSAENTSPTERPSAPDGARAFYLAALCVTLVCAAAAAAFYALAFEKQYDTALEHFNTGSPLLAAALVLAAAAYAAAVICALKLRRTAGIAAPVPGATQAQDTVCVFASALCGFMFAAFACMRLIDVFTYGGYAPLDVARCFLALPASVYFFVGASNISRSSPTLTLLGALPEAYFAVSLMNVYFSRSHALNSPQKILAQTAFVSLMLFFAAECRFPIGRASLPRTVIFGCSAVVTLTMTWLPQLAAAAMKTASYEYNLLETALFAALTLYAAAKLLSYANRLTGPPEYAGNKKEAKNKKARLTK